MRKPQYVVATDLSPPSRAALAAAVVLARRTGAVVDLFCAVPASIVDEEQLLLDRVRDGLTKLTARTKNDGVETRCEVVVARDVPASVVAHANAHDAEILVVGPSGVTGWKKFVLGSVTERLLRLAPTMLLVARGKLPDPPKCLLVALDMTQGSTRALRVAIDLARSCGSKLVALHVVAPPGAALMAAGDVYLPETWSLEAERVAQAQREFGTWVKDFPKSGVDVEARVVEGNPAEVVIDEAKAVGADLVVVGSHGKTAVHEFFVGSVAHNVATHCPVSVLVVRARPPKRTGIGRKNPVGGTGDRGRVRPA
ncbi:MAG: universal stress protein [Planctomycetes bacterium]|nr:universal stress protein [Planctomycetota bacterium]